jgi:hypothetical protein
VTEVPSFEGFWFDVIVVVVGGSISSESAGDVDVALLSSPLYTAVIECVPAPSVAVEKTATLDVFSVAVPISIVPSKKLTVPVGGEVPDVITFAVNVTTAPTPAGFRLVVSTARVGSPARAVVSSMTKVGLLPAFDWTASVPYR